MTRRDRLRTAVVLVEGEAVVRAQVTLVEERQVPRTRAQSDQALRLLRRYEQPIEVVIGTETMPLTGGLELARVLARAPHPVAVLFVSTPRWLAMHRPDSRRPVRRLRPVPFDPDRILEFLESLWLRARAA